MPIETEDHKPLPRTPWEGPDIDQTPVDVPPLVQSPPTWPERLLGWARAGFGAYNLIRGPKEATLALLAAILALLARLFRRRP